MALELRDGRADECAMEFDWRAFAADHSPDLLLVLDETWTVTYASEEPARAAGYDRAEFVGRSIPFELVHPDDQAYVTGALIEAGRMEGLHLPAQFRMRWAGEWQTVEACDRTGPIAGPGSPTCVVLSIRPTGRRDLPAENKRELEALVQRVTSACAAARPDEIDEVVSASLGWLGTLAGAHSTLLSFVNHEAGTLDLADEWIATPGRSFIAERPTIPLSDLRWDARFVPDLGYVAIGRFEEGGGDLDRPWLDSFGVTMIIDVVIASHGRPVAVLSVMFDRDLTKWHDSHIWLVRMIGDMLTVTIQRLGDYRRLQHQVLHDSLTGLPNRDLLQMRLAQVESDVVLFFCDLDGFKAVNDRWGHELGDRVLIEVGRRLVSQVRADDIVARIGGDEFVVVCPAMLDHEALHMAMRLEDAVSSLAGLGEAEFSISLSVGLTQHVVGDPVETSLRRADESMYSTKLSRRHGQ